MTPSSVSDQGTDRSWLGQSYGFSRFWGATGSSSGNNGSSNTDSPDRSTSGTLSTQEQPPLTGQLEYSQPLGSSSSLYGSNRPTEHSTRVQQRTLSQPSGFLNPGQLSALGVQDSDIFRVDQSSDALSFSGTVVGLSYIKSFFRRRPLSHSQTDSGATTASLPAIPEPTTPSFQDLNDVTEKDIQEMFPRVIPRPASSTKGG